MNSHSNKKQPTPFWKKKSLFEMNQKEWEALCDGCGLCCLAKVEDEDTQEIFNTNVHCKLFNPKTAQCRNYKKRKNYVSDCLILTPKKVYKLNWLPRTCAYRLLAEGKDLYPWHYLVSGSKSSVHKAGVSARKYNLVSEERVKDLRDHVQEDIEILL